jgi:hypothetical protein
MAEILLAGVKNNVGEGGNGNKCGGQYTSALKQGYLLPIMGQN